MKGLESGVFSEEDWKCKMKQSAKTRITANDIYIAIEKLHQGPEWACFPEVNQGTGSQSGRRADAVAMSLWPSRGLIVRGFEIKVSRSDLKKESKDPSKAETIAAYCDEWWIATPRDLIKDDLEISPAWGIMEFSDGSMTTRRKAEKTDTKTISRPFLASLLRAASKRNDALSGEYVLRSEIQEMLERERKFGVTEGQRNCQYAMSRTKEMENVFSTFKKYTGVDVYEQYGPNSVDSVLSAIRVGRILNASKYGSNLKAIASHTKQLQEKLKSLMSALEEVVPEEIK